jgi:Tol biopolymer transport system component
VIEREPNLMRVLRCQPVETERAEKAEDSVGNALADLRKRVVFGNIRVRQCIEPPPGAVDNTRRNRLTELDAIYAVAGQVARSAHRGGTKGGTQAFLGGSSHNKT